MSMWNFGTFKKTTDHPATQNLDANPFPDPDESLCQYRDDIWQTLLQQAAEKPKIHLQSPQLEFRGALVLLLRDSSKKLGLNIGTLHSAVYFLDRFMDKHNLREDRLMLVAIACLSLATKNEEKSCHVANIKTLSLASRTTICPKTFKQLEWMIGQHLHWRLLAPTPVNFASLLAKYVVSDRDNINRHPVFLKKFKRDGAWVLEKYLDLSLSNYRLTVMNSTTVACACVACARTGLKLSAWPAWLAALTDREWSEVSEVVRILQGMMERCVMRARQKTHQQIIAMEIACSVSERISNPADPAYTKNRPLDPLQASASVPIKRSLALPTEIDNKRCRLSVPGQFMPIR